MTIHRTTIRLDEELVREAKRVALERGTTLTALVEAGLRSALEPQAHQKKLTALPTVGGRLGPGVDLEDHDRLSELAYGCAECANGDPAHHRAEHRTG